jgi:hypothetical protein
MEKSTADPRDPARVFEQAKIYVGEANGALKAATKSDVAVLCEAVVGLVTITRGSCASVPNSPVRLSTPSSLFPHSVSQRVESVCVV